MESDRKSKPKIKHEPISQNFDSDVANLDDVSSDIEDLDEPKPTHLQRVQHIYYTLVVTFILHVCNCLIKLALRYALGP